MRCFVVLLIFSLQARVAFAKAPPRPGAPSMDDDLFDDDDFDLPPEFSGGAPKPPGAGGPARPDQNNTSRLYMPPDITPVNPVPDAGGFNPSSQGVTTSAKKFRFKLVDGEFWEKGKKRGRGAQTHVSSSSDTPGAGS